MVFACMFLMAACKKEENAAPAPQDNPGAAGQSFTVKMTDAPGDFEALDVKVVGVEAYLEGQGWVTIDNRAKAVNVVSLTNGAETEIAVNNNAQAGVYTKLKVKFDPQAELKLNAYALVNYGGVIKSDNRIDLVWLYSGANEVEIAINETVTAQTGAEVLLDFDAAASVIEDGNKYLLQPVIREIKDARTGIQGEVEGQANAAIVITDGTNTFATYINAEGKFMLKGIKPGVYKLIIDPAAKAIDDVEKQNKELSGVVIVEGQITQMGKIAL